MSQFEIQTPRRMVLLAIAGIFAALATANVRGEEPPTGSYAAAPGTNVAAANLGNADTASATAGTSDGSSTADGKSPAASAPRGPRIEGGQVNGHWREGTRLVDQLGQFKVSGDRLSFTSADGSLHFDCLENLCGQRVARTVTDSPEPLTWLVTGELTEFRGVNFMLLTQTILTPRVRRSPAAP